MYTIVVNLKGCDPIVRKNVDYFNSIIIPAEIKLAFPEAVKKGTLSIEVKEEKDNDKKIK